MSAASPKKRMRQSSGTEEEGVMEDVLALKETKGKKMAFKKGYKMLQKQQELKRGLEEEDSKKAAELLSKRII